MGVQVSTSNSERLAFVTNAFQPVSRRTEAMWCHIPTTNHCFFSYVLATRLSQKFGMLPVAPPASIAFAVTTTSVVAHERASTLAAKDTGTTQRSFLCGDDKFYIFLALNILCVWIWFVHMSKDDTR